MLGFIGGAVKLVLVSVILAGWIASIVILKQIIRKHPWEDDPSHRFLSLAHPQAARIVIWLSAIVTFLIITVVAGGLLIGIINF